MSKVTKVFLKDSGKAAKVYFTDDNKPIIDELIKDKWQTIINKIAKLISVRASLINTLDEDHIEVFMLSQNETNPYKVGLCDPLGQGAYCEMVMGKKDKLNVKNAKEDPVWMNSLYAEYNLLSYYGLPIIWPDGEVFGTLCVIDDKENDFDDEFQEIFLEFKLSIEKDLEILMQRHELSLIAEFDGLTGVYNRRKIDSILDNEFSRSKRNHRVFSVVLFDLDRFKAINDVFGHQMGDTVLKEFARHLDNRIRKTDFFGRLGGDEFILICPDTDYDGTYNLIQSFRKNLLKDMRQFVEDFNFSYGIAVYDNDEKYEDILKKADDELYKMKNNNRS